MLDLYAFSVLLLEDKYTLVSVCLIVFSMASEMEDIRAVTDHFLKVFHRSKSLPEYDLLVGVFDRSFDSITLSTEVEKCPRISTVLDKHGRRVDKCDIEGVFLCLAMLVKLLLEFINLSLQSIIFLFLFF